MSAKLRTVLACLLLTLSAFALPQKDEAAAIAKLEKAQKTAKAAYLKKPKDTKLKKAYITATNKVGYTVMTSGLPPAQKYPKALKYYRETKKVDPKNAEANKWIKTIEDIYRSLGRPIPKG